MNWISVLKSTVTLFAIVNPIGGIPLFMQLTSKMTPPQRMKAFRTGVLSGALILFVFILAGERVLTDFFQIGPMDLMAAGGLLLVIIAIDHLVFGSLVRGVLSAENQDAAQIGAVPIGCPILAGPGAMMAVLLTYSEQGMLAAVVSVLLVFGGTWLILCFVDRIYALIGNTVCLVLSKILCLFIAAIGMRLLMQGVAHYLK